MIMRILFAMFFSFAFLNAQDITPVSEAAENLDLGGVLELFQNSKDLEEFETKLNEPENDINNIDLDENGEVDFIRVNEEQDGASYVIVLQAVLGENEYQDIATIEIEKQNDDEAIVQAIGAEDLYGEDYIVEPASEDESTEITVVNVNTYPTMRWMFRPGRRRWISPWRFSVLPPWWRPWRPVPRSTYRARHVHRRNVRVTRHRRVRRSNAYKPRTSSKVKHNTKASNQKKKSTSKKQTTKKQTNKKQTKNNSTYRKKNTSRQKSSGRSGGRSGGGGRRR